MKKNTSLNSKKLYITSVFVFITVIVTIGIAYSILGVGKSYNNIIVNTTVGSRPVFTSSGAVNISMNPEYIAQTATSETVLNTSTGSINVALTANAASTVTCSFDVLWAWDSTSDTTKQYSKTSGATKELTVTGTIDGSSLFSETQIQNYNASNRIQKLASSSISASSNTMVAKTITINSKFYKTKAVQSGHRGHSYSGQIYINNVVCRNA